MSLKIPKDMEILKFCQQARNRYQIAKHFGNNYANTYAYINRLERLGYLFVVSEKEGSIRKSYVIKKGPRAGTTVPATEHPRNVKDYLITDKGRAILRGFKEANRE